MEINLKNCKEAVKNKLMENTKVKEEYNQVLNKISYISSLGELNTLYYYNLEDDENSSTIYEDISIILNIEGFKATHNACHKYIYISWR